MIPGLPCKTFSEIAAPQDSLSELGSVFCKIFDPDMSPLGFELDQMYHFAIRLVHLVRFLFSLTF
jgi:hypothetical protein